MSTRYVDSHSRHGRKISISGSGSGGGTNNSNNNSSQYTRHSRSRSRCRDLSWEQAGNRRRDSCSRSRENLMRNRSANSDDNDLNRGLITNEDRGNRYDNTNSRNNNLHRREDKYEIGRKRNRKRERDREQDRDREQQRDRENEPDRNRDTERDREGEQDRQREQDREIDRDRIENGERDGEREQDRELNRDREHNSGNEKRIDFNSEYRSHNNVSRAQSGNNRDRQQYHSADKERYESDKSDDSHFISNNEVLNEIRVFGLHNDITEKDISNALDEMNIKFLSVRVIRNRFTGESRGYALVEFKTAEEATRWMEITQGTMSLGEHTISLEYATFNVNKFKRRYMRLKRLQDEGIDEISTTLTKRIMLRNLDALTNEESVLTALQKVLPKLATIANKVRISRDTLTKTSRGICYLNFETLVDSMDVHNALTSLDPPLKIDDRDVSISYCMDAETHQVSKDSQSAIGSVSGALTAVSPSDASGTYTLADVPRLAKYNASLYASTPEEHAHYVQYYTNYFEAYIKTAGTQPGDQLLGGEPVKLPTAATFAKRSVIPPTGNSGATYPAPDLTQYQYDTTSGKYYDPSTGLYYDAHSQYYYNDETGAYLYWDQRRSTYILATPASTQAPLKESLEQETLAVEKDEEMAKKNISKDKENNMLEKAMVAKAIVKDMEKWAKQLNQKKDYTAMAKPNPVKRPSMSRTKVNAYADVGFTILEKTEQTTAPLNKLVNVYGNSSESEEDELNYVNYQNLTCLLCRRAFQSHNILQKHLKMSELHKVNLAKLKMSSGVGASNDNTKSAIRLKENLTNNCRDRTEEPRLKNGMVDPPPSNGRQERFEHVINKKDSVAAPAMPISSNNVGSRLLQKMGWSEGQGLGRSNQGGTQIIEPKLRLNNMGLGHLSKGNVPGPGEDYKTFIKKMMKSRYKNA